MALHVWHAPPTAGQDFLTCVAEGRKMRLEDVRQLAKGRVYTGRQALEVRRTRGVSVCMRGRRTDTRT